MQRFWETVIEPVFETLQPKIIVEIGSDQGGNTENLLEFCRRTDATLHVIDPAPRYDISEWRRGHGERLVFHKDISLNSLPAIEDFDAVLIDGDHNWYTVFNELKTIERLCNERSQRFPFVMLHDIGWPYGRRDLYYEPDTIPEEYRKPYEKKGMRPGIMGLLEMDGLNQHLYNAVLENESQGGVLTAVEDFLEETEHRLELLRLPGIHGLGILFPSQLKDRNDRNAKLATFLEQLRFSPFVSRYIESVDRARLEIQILQQEERINFRRRLQEESQKLRDARKNLTEACQELRETRQQLRAERKRLNETERDEARLAGWIGELDEGISALLSSRQWKTGRALGELRRKALRKPKENTAAEHLEKVLEKFHSWRDK